MAGDNSTNWQEINLVDDEAAMQGTRALRFMVERIHQAKHNPSLCPQLQNLFRAYELVLNENDDRMEDLLFQAFEGEVKTWYLELPPHVQTNWFALRIALLEEFGDGFCIQALKAMT